MAWEELLRLVAVVPASFLVCYFSVGRMAKNGLVSGKRLLGLFRADYSHLDCNVLCEVGMFLVL